MGIGKNITYMVLGSVALLQVLGVADPSNRRLMTSFFSTTPAPGVVPKGALDEAGMLRALAEFNSTLSAAYLTLEPAALMAVAMDDALKQRYVEELAFLQAGGRALELTVQDIRIERVARLLDLTLSVDTVETVKVRYLNPLDRSELEAHPAARYAMNYTLEQSGSGWKIVGVETIKAGARDD